MNLAITRSYAKKIIIEYQDYAMFLFVEKSYSALRNSLKQRKRETKCFAGKNENIALQNMGPGRQVLI